MQVNEKEAGDGHFFKKWVIFDETKLLPFPSQQKLNRIQGLATRFDISLI